MSNDLTEDFMEDSSEGEYLSESEAEDLSETEDYFEPGPLAQPAEDLIEQAADLNILYADRSPQIFINVITANKLVIWINDISRDFMLLNYGDPDEPIKITIYRDSNTQIYITIENAGLLEFRLENVITECLQLTAGCLSEIVEGIYQIVSQQDRSCLICGTAIAGDVRPILCPSERCLFQMAETALGDRLITYYLNYELPVVNLLAIMLNTACRSNREVTPLPHLPCSEITQLLGEIPWSTLSDKYSTLTNAQKQMVRWLIFQNKTVLQLIIREDLPEEIRDTPGQVFFEIINSPEKEAEFEELAHNQKVIYAYHGSPAQNWHSILHNYLQNYSGTSREVHGHVYGHGIYLGISPQISMSYSRSPLTLKGDLYNDMHMYMINQIILTDQSRRHGDFCYIIPEGQYLLNKYLVLYQ